MKRILLFLVTNFAILMVASVTLRLLGVEPWLNANGISFRSLLIFGAVLGFGGALPKMRYFKRIPAVTAGSKLKCAPKTASLDAGGTRHFPFGYGRLFRLG